MSAARLRDVPRSLWIAGAMVATYLAAELLFAYVTGTSGLLSPSGTPHLGVLAIGAVFLGLRLLAYFLAPAIAVYGVLGVILSRAARRRSTRPAAAPP